MYINDPVRDAENAQEVKRRAYAQCSECGAELFGEDSLHYGDTSYFLDGGYICECCIDGYLQTKRRGAPCV